LSQVTLLTKLHEVAKAIDFVEKRGRNDHHQYNFAQAVDVTRTVRDKLLEHGIVIIPGATNARHLPYGSKGAHLTTVDLNYRIFELEDGTVIEVPWTGVGADTGGDKGIYKAFTGGLKYMLLTLFLVPTSDDPERDQLTESSAPEEHKDDARPAAPRIPADRAGALNMDAAPGTPPEFNPVFKALLAQQEVDKIGLLNVDQAEAVEAFLREEAKGE
jgi:hypothetical protein